MNTFNRADYLLLFDNQLLNNIIKEMEVETCDDFINSSFSDDASRLRAMIKINTLRELKGLILKGTLNSIEKQKKQII